MLLSLIQNKINYHKTEILSRQIRRGFGEDVSRSEKRIDDLKQINEALSAFLKEARQQGKRLEVEGSFTLKIVD